MGSPPKLVTFSDFKGLHQKWEQNPQLRKRLRDFSALILEQAETKGDGPRVPTGSCPKTVGNLRLNCAILSPLLVKMSKSAECGRDGVPCVETMIGEIDDLYKMHGLCPVFSKIRDEAWSIRYILGVLKGYLWKPKPPSVT